MVSRLGLPLILGAFILLAIAFSVIAPLGEAPDEVPHFAYIQYLVLHHQLPPPEGAVSGESHQPPLYYFLGAALTAPIPRSGFQVIANPDFAFDNLNTPNLLVHDAREAFPYRDDVLAWHLARLLSVAVGAVTVWATWQIAREVFPNDPWTAIGAAAFVAFLPGFVFISAVVNNDNLIAMLASLSILQVIRMIGQPFKTHDSIVLGILLGLAALTKLSGFIVWLFAAIVLFATAYRNKNLRAIALHCALCFGIAAAIIAPWIAYNLVEYGDPVGYAVYLTTGTLRDVPLTWRDAADIMRGLFTSFLGRFGGAIHIRLPTGIYAGAALVSLASLVGWFYFWRDMRAQSLNSSTKKFAALALLFWLPLLLAYAQWSLQDRGVGQARLLFPGLSLLAIAFVSGWGRCFHLQARIAILVLSVALGLLALGALAFLNMIYAFSASV